MKKTISILIFALSAINLNGCFDNASANGNPVDYSEIESTGSYLDNPNSERKRTEVIDSEQDLTSTLSLYEHAFLEAEINEINFSENKVVLVSLGLSSSDVSLSLSNVESFDEYVKVRYMISRSCSDCVVSASATFPMKLFIINTRDQILVEEDIDILE